MDHVPVLRRVQRFTPLLGVVIDELLPGARLRAMHGLKRDRTASTIIRGHALMQNIR